MRNSYQQVLLWYNPYADFWGENSEDDDELLITSTGPLAAISYAIFGEKESNQYPLWPY
jgi:hypothetical protein